METFTRTELDQLLEQSRRQLMASNKEGISATRGHLRYIYTSRKGNTYPQMRTKILDDAAKYYGKCTVTWLENTLPVSWKADGAVLWGC